MSLVEKEWFIEASWGRICIVAWGNCFNPPVLVLHGQLDSAASFRPLIKMLPDKYYYIGMELPGNGRSDPYPPGLMINMFDLVYPIEVVRRHFRWDNFVFIAHSISSAIGRFYQLTYPNRMLKAVEIDQVWGPITTEPEDFTQWYDRFFTSYYEKYDQYNASKVNRGTQSWQEAIEKLCNERHLSLETARATLERWTEPTDERHHLIRYTYDRRLTLITPPPISAKQLKTLYARVATPTLAVISKDSIENGLYDNVPFLIEEEMKNYRVLKVDGHHYVFITNPERMASFISQFLMNGLDGWDGRAKL